MLFRDVGKDVIAIPQPSHAWLLGQLLRAWGNAVARTRCTPARGALPSAKRSPSVTA